MLLKDDRAIARREEQRQARATAELALESVEIAGGTMCYAGPGSWANQAAGLGFEGPVGDAELDQLVRFFEERGCEPRIELAPFAHPSLIEGLRERGFLLLEFERVLVRELDARDWRALHPHGWPADLELVRLDPTNAAQVDAYTRLSHAGFAAPGSPLSASWIDITRRTLEHERTTAYLATCAGELAGAGCVDAGLPGAALFGTVVEPAFRRRGVQLALILERLAVAQERGSVQACIHSEPAIATARNARRVGFRTAYDKVLMVRPGEGLERGI